MKDSPDTPEAAAAAATRSAPADDDWGWYLYGITRAEQKTSERFSAGASMWAEDNEHIEAISSGDLSAIVRRVPVAEFSTEALHAQAEDLSWIEAIARRHNAIIEAVHRTRAILPAKFGCVYASSEDVQMALRQEHDAVLARLDTIDGCDEWGVRLYGDVAVIRQRAGAEQEVVQRLRQELAAASPGRAYFLQRKLENELAKAAEHVLDNLVGQAYEHFAHHARAGQLSRQMSSSQINQDADSTEIVQAAFLVPRESADAFIEDVRQFSEHQSGLWCEYSGPWPPYNFAAQIEEE